VRRKEVDWDKVFGTLTVASLTWPRSLVKREFVTENWDQRGRVSGRKRKLIILPLKEGGTTPEKT